MPRAPSLLALPFPPAQFAHYHDHWLALVALSLGEIRFVDRPLYDYVQHGHAALGHAAANRMPSLRSRLVRRDRRDSVRKWRMHYFVDACRLLQCIAILRLRCEGRITPRARRALVRLARADRSWSSLALLGYRGARELTGRGETLGAEWMLFWAFVWRRLVAATAVVVMTAGLERKAERAIVLRGLLQVPHGDGQMIVG